MIGAGGTKANWAAPNSKVKNVNLVQILQEASTLWFKSTGSGGNSSHLPSNSNSGNLLNLLVAQLCNGLNNSIYLMGC